MDKLFLLMNYLSRHNIFVPSKNNKNWYWRQQPLKPTIIIPTRTILHPRLDFIIIIYVQDIPDILCSIIQAKKYIQRHPIIMTNADYDCILDGIERCGKFEFEGNVSVNSGSRL